MSMIRPLWSDWENVLKDAEALTIYRHSPPYNSSNIGTYKGQTLRVVNNGERGDLCKSLSAEKPSLIKMKYFLQLIELDPTSFSYPIQSDVFEVTSKTKRLILRKARKNALNNVLREDMRDCFEKGRWEGDNRFSFRGHDEGKYQVCLILTEAPEDAQITYLEP